MTGFIMKICTASKKKTLRNWNHGIYILRFEDINYILNWSLHTMKDCKDGCNIWKKSLL